MARNQPECPGPMLSRSALIVPGRAAGAARYGIIFDPDWRQPTSASVSAGPHLVSGRPSVGVSRPPPGSQSIHTDLTFTNSWMPKRESSRP